MVLAITVMTVRVTLTYHDYVALPDDGKRYEIHDGELSVTAAPVPLHQMVSVNLVLILCAHVNARALGQVLYSPLDVILSDTPGETTIVQPDIIFLDRGRRSLISPRAIEGPPTLVVEILSPSTAAIDRIRKRALYAHYGVPYYWLVDVNAREVEACELRAGEYVVAARVSGSEPVDLPPFVGLALVPASLWP
jgi:Uma2 family endonuclease